MADVDVVSVRVKPNTSTFRQELRAALTKINTDVSVDIKAKIDTTKVQAELKKLTADVPTAKIKVQASPEQFQAQIDQLIAGTRVKQIEIDADTAKVKAELDRLTAHRFVLVDADAKIAAAEAKLEALTAKKRLVTVNANAQLTGLRAALDEATRPRTVEVDVDLSKVTASVVVAKRVFSQLSAESQKLKGVTTDLIGDVLKLGATFAKLGLATAAVASLTLSVTNLGLVLASASGAALLIPGALAVAGLSFATIKLGISGINKAFDALNPTIKKLRDSISATFQKSLAPSIKEINGLIPQFTKGFQLIATNISLAGKSFTTAFKQNAKDAFNINGVGTFNSLLLATAKISGDVAKAFGPFAVALLNIASIGGQILAPLTGGLQQAAQHLLDFTQSAEGINKIKTFVSNGIDTLKQLGSIAKDVGGIIGGIFDAAKASGGGLLTIFKDIASGLKDFVKSDVGQSSLIDFFTSLREIVGAFLPVVKTVAGAIGSILAPAVADIAKAIAPGVDAVAKALASLIKAAGPGITALADGISRFFIALGPAIGPLGKQLGDFAANLGLQFQALATPVGRFIDALAPHLPEIADALGAVARAGLSLLEAAVPLVKPLTDIAIAVGEQLGPVFKALGDVLVEIAPQLGDIVTQLIKNLGPILPDLVRAFGKIVDVLVRGLLPSLPGLVSIAIFLIGTWVKMIPITLIMASTLELMVGFGIALIQLLTGDFTGAAQTASTSWQTAQETMKLATSSNWQQMGDDILAKGRGIQDATKMTWDGVRNTTKLGVDGVGALIAAGGDESWVPAALDAAGGVDEVLSNGQHHWQGTVEEGMSNLGGIFNHGFGTLNDTAQQGANGINDKMGTLAGQIPGNFSGLDVGMEKIGRSIVQGIINGIQSLIGSLISKLQTLAGLVFEVVSGGLKINSPSKVMRDKVGVSIPEGIAVGIDKGAHFLVSSLNSMTDMIVAQSSGAIDTFSAGTADATLQVNQGASSPLEIAANSAFDQVVRALDGWGVQIDPRGLASLARTGANQNAAR